MRGGGGARRQPDIGSFFIKKFKMKNYIIYLDKRKKKKKKRKSKGEKKKIAKKVQNPQEFARGGIQFIEKRLNINIF